MVIGFLSHLDLNLYAFRLPVMLELKKLGHKPIAIAPNGQFLEKIRQAGIECISYEISRKSLNPLNELRAIQNIYLAIKPLELNILHTFTAKPNIYGTIAGKMARVPKIINLVEGLGSFYLENDTKSALVRTIIEQLYKQVFKISTKVMFVNSDDPSYMISKRIVDTEKVFKINGVGIDCQTWMSHKKQNENTTVKVIMVGRAIRHKGVVEFYECAKAIKSKKIDVSFIYVGGTDDGNHSSLDEEYMKSSPFVEYLGERADIQSLIDSADIFVLPSYREGLPRTILEAMSLQKPVVATDVTGCRDCVIDGKNGYLVPAKNVEALVFAVEDLIVNKQKRVEFGLNGRKMAEELYDVKQIVKAHMKVYGIDE